MPQAEAPSSRPELLIDPLVRVCWAPRLKEGVVEWLSPAQKCLSWKFTQQMYHREKMLRPNVKRAEESAAGYFYKTAELDIRTPE